MAFKPKAAGGSGAARAGIDWILNPDIDFTETDTLAAGQALGSGLSGSQFAGINNLRLRDSERMNRITLGNQLLNPFLDREQATELEGSRQAGEDRRLAVSGQQAMERLAAEQSGNLQLADREERARLNQLAQEGAQAMARLQLTEGGETVRQGAAIAGQQQNVQSQIAAQSARDAIEQSGLDRRLGTEAAARLQLAILQGDQNAQEALLREAGLNARQREATAANLEQSRLNAQNDLLRTLISIDGSGTRGGGSTARGTGVTQLSSTLPAGRPNVVGTTGGAFNPTARPGTAAPSSGGSTNRYTSYINNILRGYGLS